MDQSVPCSPSPLLKQLDEAPAVRCLVLVMAETLKSDNRQVKGAINLRPRVTWLQTIMQLSRGKRCSTYSVCLD